MDPNHVGYAFPAKFHQTEKYVWIFESNRGRLFDQSEEIVKGLTRFCRMLFSIALDMTTLEIATFLNMTNRRRRSRFACDWFGRLKLEPAIRRALHQWQRSGLSVNSLRLHQYRLTQTSLTLGFAKNDWGKHCHSHIIGRRILIFSHPSKERISTF